MSSSIKYAYLKQQTWLYRRNFPKDLQPILGAALKQSLKTGDTKLAKARAAEVNAKYEDLVQKAESGEDLTTCAADRVIQLVPPRFPQTKGRVALVGRTPVSELARTYLNKRSRELRPGGFKSVRFSIGLLVSLYGTRPIGSLSREDGRLFLKLISELSPDVGKSIHSRDLGLEQLVKRSAHYRERISVRTQKRIWTQAGHFLDWALYEGHLAEAPFKTIRIEGTTARQLLLCSDRQGGHDAAERARSGSGHCPALLPADGDAVRGGVRALARRSANQGQPRGLCQGTAQCSQSAQVRGGRAGGAAA